MTEHVQRDGSHAFYPKGWIDKSQVIVWVAKANEVYAVYREFGERRVTEHPTLEEALAVAKACLPPEPPSRRIWLLLLAANLLAVALRVAWGLA